MQASETTIRKLIEGSRQYVIPLFQRPYSWKQKHWSTLWQDVVELVDDPNARPHFFGSTVTAPARSVPQGVGKWLLIDGQQRLTTAQLFLAALRDAATHVDATTLAQKIEGQSLLTAYEVGDEQLKVLPTQLDRKAFRAIIRRDPPVSSRLTDCYQYFLSRLKDRKGLSGDFLERLYLVLVDRLSLVGITCDEQDNPHLIFESLNAKGEKLTAADLIRNFLLMRIHVNEQQRVFDDHWRPIQEALDDQLTEFVRHYLMKEGKIIKSADIYFELKDRLNNATPDQSKHFLADLHRHGMYYARFIAPSKHETDSAISSRLSRLRVIEATVAYPLLLRVFDAVHQGSLTRSQLLEVLDILESFLIRRSVCGYPSNQLRKILPPIFDAVGGPGESFIAGVRDQLGGKRCPDDKAFTESLLTQPLYATAMRGTRLRIVLERLEESFEHKEPAPFSNRVEIEHVMPQTLTPEWIKELGSDALDHHARLLHTIGNLTLTAYNPDLSNKPYSEKRTVLNGSHFELNRYFADVEHWTPAAIEARGEAIAKRALTIWPDVGRDRVDQADTSIAVQKPVAVLFQGKSHRVRTWREGAVKLIEMFEAAQPGILASLAAKGELLTELSADSSRFPRSKVCVGGVYFNTHASVHELKRRLKRIAQRAGIGDSEYAFVAANDWDAAFDRPGSHTG
jgi:uncharacterized protein with ParB-like and HNH nuclease domain